MNHTRRLRHLRRSMQGEGIGALLVTHLPDIRYLCGFSGSNGALAITARRAALFTDGRYTEQARQETRAARVFIATKSAQREACAWLAAAGVAHCAFDPAHTMVADLTLFRESLGTPRRARFFQPLATPFVLNQRLIKDAGELAIMERAAHLGVKLFEDLLTHIHSGMTEAELAGRLELNARMRGAEGMSFETIVASGPRSALPHGRATARPLSRNGFVTLDFGVILKGYCSDMTRTVFLGKSTRRERFTYDAVREAQQAAVDTVKPGVTCGEVDEAARSVLRKAGLADYFTHSTGHGVGLEIHEMPRIAAAQQQVLAPGMVITIEPGAYIPNRFGVRIEDMVAVTQHGARMLTPAPTAWIEL
jgi:Xaa-Pro aminopeptidase